MPISNVDGTKRIDSDEDIDRSAMMKEFMAAGFPTIVLHIARENAHSQEGCFAIVSYKNLSAVLPKHGWGSPSASPRPFAINALPAKGLGMIATRDIQPGELIHKERFTIAAPQVAMGLEWSAKRREQLLKKGLEMLPEQMRETLFALHDCKLRVEGGPLTGMLQTNSIRVRFKQVEHMQLYGAVFPDISRVNHSCCPNAAYGRFDYEACTIELRATHHIAKDAEITIAYVGTLDAREVRQKALLDSYGFLCDCESCGLDAKKSRESDARRWRIGGLSSVFIDDPYAEAHVKQWIDDRSMPETLLINVHLRVIVAIEREKDSDNRPEHCGVIAACYAALGDEENTRKWCAKADVYCQVDIRDPNEELENVWATWKDSPRDHPFWGLRTSERSSSFHLA